MIILNGMNIRKIIFFPYSVSLLSSNILNNNLVDTSFGFLVICSKYFKNFRPLSLFRILIIFVIESFSIILFNKLFPNKVFPKKTYPNKVIAKINYFTQLFTQITYPNKVIAKITYPTQIFTRITYPNKVFNLIFLRIRKSMYTFR